MRPPQELLDFQRFRDALAHPVKKHVGSLRSTPIGRFVGTALSILGCISCSPPADLPHVILISIDTLRDDHLGCYGADRPTSPAIDALALDAIQFEEAISQAAWTLPSHMSLMTSLMPSRHGVTASRALDPAVVTLAEALREAGYASAGFVSWVFLSKNFGFDQGFDEYWCLVDQQKLDMSGGGGALSAGPLVEGIMQWLTRREDHPLFLFVHLFDPHMDYVPPGEFSEIFAEADAPDINGRYETLRPFIRGLHEDPALLSEPALRHIESLYDGEIRYVDAQVQKLLAALDSCLGLEDCHVILLSDHGEEFMDHGSIEGHGWTLYEEIVRVPLIWRLPTGARAGTTVSVPVGLIDVAPTLLDFLGIDPPRGFEGVSRREVMEGRGDPGYVLAENDRFNIRQRVLRGNRLKLIHTADTGLNAAGVPIRSGFELYDLVNDPGETRNLFDPDEERSQALVALLNASIPEADGSIENPAAILSDAQLELLRSLGYVE